MAAFVIGRNNMYGYIFLIFNLPSLKVYDSLVCKGLLNYFESIIYVNMSEYRLIT